jgi:hypothetical protein
MPKMFSPTKMFLKCFFAHENMKKPASKAAKPAQIQPKSQFLFHKNLPPRNFSIITLYVVGKKLTKKGCKKAKLKSCLFFNWPVFRHAIGKNTLKFCFCCRIFNSISPKLHTYFGYFHDLLLKVSWKKAQSMVIAA